jgi:carbon monoxide dehydrogenase subunit G
VFIGDEVVLHVSFTAAKARLANLARGGSLVSASADAYDEGITGLVRVGPLSSAPGMSTLVEVHFLDLVSREDSALLALRWEAMGPGGRLFPALDADITLTPAGEHATLITLAGAYRPPLGTLGATLDRAILHRVAAATIQTFINRVADAIAHPASGMGEPGRGNARTAPSRLPPTAQMP